MTRAIESRSFMVYALKSPPKRSLDGAPSGVGGSAWDRMRAPPDPHLVLDSRAPAGFFLVSASRALLFASVVAERCLVRDTNFFDSWTTSASFAFTRLVISRLSPVFGIYHPSSNTSVHADCGGSQANRSGRDRHHGLGHNRDAHTLLLVVVYFCDGCLMPSL